MATAKKLPSGSWRVLVYDYTDESGKRHYQSFTSDEPGPKGKREAEYAAAEFARNKEEQKQLRDSITFGEALEKYIQNRSSVLSPRTILNYKRIQGKDLLPLRDIKLPEITQETIQNFVNVDSKIHSPKTVRDIHGLISAILKENRPDFALNTTLPKLKRPELYIPTDHEITRLLECAKDTELELPILLAAFGPMRRGEICALHTKNISGNVVHVKENMVLNEDKTWVIKQPKSYAGDRYIPYPDFVAEKWKGLSGRITDLTPDNISNRFTRLLKCSGIPHFRFHDLRHYCASIQHALGIPDAYIMKRGGWSSDGVLKNVYRHALADKEESMDSAANLYFENLCNTKCNTKIKKP